MFSPGWILSSDEKRRGQPGRQGNDRRSKLSMWGSRRSWISMMDYEVRMIEETPIRKQYLTRRYLSTSTANTMTTVVANVWQKDDVRVYQYPKNYEASYNDMRSTKKGMHLMRQNHLCRPPASLTSSGFQRCIVLWLLLGNFNDGQNRNKFLRNKKRTAILDLISGRAPRSNTLKWGRALVVQQTLIPSLGLPCVVLFWSTVLGWCFFDLLVKADGVALLDYAKLWTPYRLS